MVRRALLLTLLLSACESAPSGSAPRPTGASSDPTSSTSPLERADAPHTPFDAAVTVVDSTEPPEQVVQIPPRPIPPARPLPRPTPPPSPQPPRSSAGRCDVRGTESYCFAYTGEGWTTESARAQCDAAPEASFSTGSCPLEGRIATCTFERESTPGREIVYTYYAPYEPALAALACPGTFTRIE